MKPGKRPAQRFYAAQVEKELGAYKGGKARKLQPPSSWLHIVAEIEAKTEPKVSSERTLSALAESVAAL